METVGKRELALAVKEAIGLTREDSLKAVDAVLGLAREALLNGQAVRLSGVGKLETTHIAERMGRDLSGNIIKQRANKRVRFKVSHQLKKRLNISSPL